MGCFYGWISLCMVSMAKPSSLYKSQQSVRMFFTAHPEGGDEYHDPEWFTEQFAATPSIPVRFYIQTGRIEWLLAPNRRFAAVLADKGYCHSYEELPSGHNWATWEQGLEPGLISLFGSIQKARTNQNRRVRAKQGSHRFCSLLFVALIILSKIEDKPSLVVMSKRWLIYSIDKMLVVVTVFYPGCLPVSVDY